MGRPAVSTTLSDEYTTISLHENWVEFTHAIEGKEYRLRYIPGRDAATLQFRHVQPIGRGTEPTPVSGQRGEWTVIGGNEAVPQEALKAAKQIHQVKPNEPAYQPNESLAKVRTVMNRVSDRPQAREGADDAKQGGKDKQAKGDAAAMSKSKLTLKQRLAKWLGIKVKPNTKGSSVSVAATQK